MLFNHQVGVFRRFVAIKIIAMGSLRFVVECGDELA
jgi:hypothetical protein